MWTEKKVFLVGSSRRSNMFVQAVAVIGAMSRTEKRAVMATMSTPVRSVATNQCFAARQKQERKLQGCNYGTDFLPRTVNVVNHVKNMKTSIYEFGHTRRTSVAVLAIIAVATVAATSPAQTSSQPTGTVQPSSDATLQQQMADLHAKMAKLEAAMSSHSQQPGMPTMGGGMRMGGGMQASGGMSGMGDMQGMQGMQGMQDMEGMENKMDMMGQ